jgi:hypothetical protein
MLPTHLRVLQALDDSLELGRPVLGRRSAQPHDAVDYTEAQNTSGRQVSVNCARVMTS